MSLNTRTHSKVSPNLRRGFFIALFSLTLPLSSLFPANSNNNNLLIEGFTEDNAGKSVPYVSIVFQNSQTFILSDENGAFSYALPLQWEDSVLVQRIGYKQKVMATQELLKQGTIRLVPNTLIMDAIEIEAISHPTDIATPLSHHTKTSGSGSQDHSKMLSHIPGIHIKSYGGPAGISTLSLDGGPSSHTRVLVNGIDITSPQNGETDISQLPLPFIESMRYIPYDISHSANGGIDGTIMLESGDQQNHLNFSSGSYGHNAYDIYLKKNILGFWTSVQLGQRHDTGDYPVSWDGEERLRKNNAFDQEFAAISVRKLIRNNLYWLFSTMGSRQSRGVSGLLWSNDTISHRQDQLNLTGSNLGWIQARANTHLKVSIRSSSDDYTNPYFRINSHHNLSSYNVYLNDDRTFTPWLQVISDFSIHHDEISSSEVGTHQRTSRSLAVTPVLQLPLGLKFIPSFKQHVSPDLYDRSLWGTQLQVPIKIGPLTQIAASQGEIFRYPSFNDLYWVPGGNPNLNPEETDVTTFQAHFDLGFLGDIQMQKQKKASRNLIQWIPLLSYWQPVNVQSATRESSKLIWQFTKPEWQLSSFAHTSWIKTEDKAMSAPLRYSPDRTSAMGITWSPNAYEFNLQYDYTSARISMYGYPQHSILPDMELWSLSIARFWQTGLGNLTMVLSSNNLTDTRYETIKGYPEPGRSYRLALRIAR